MASTRTTSKYLSEDLWILILSLLPVKFILRFRCVCKSWNNFIQTSEFISTHFNRYTLRSSSEKPLHLLLYREDEDEPLESNHPHLSHHNQEQIDVFKLLSESNVNNSLNPYLSMDHPFMNHFIIGSCNGLIGLCPRKLGGSYMIWNPLIQKSITLPPPHFIEKELGYPPILGFGYDSLTNDFKIIRIMRYRRRRIKMFEIYSIRTRSWRILNCSFPDFVFDSGIHRPVFINQSVHWLGNSLNPFYGVRGLNDNRLILSFNFSTEEFVTMILPSKENRINVFDRSLQLFMGSMALVSQEGNVWVMKVYGDVDSWVKVLNLTNTNIHDFDSVKVLGFLSYGDVLYRDDCYIIAMDHLTKIWRDVDVLIRFRNKPWNLSYHRYFCIHGYHVESLVLLDEPNLVLG